MYAGTSRRRSACGATRSSPPSGRARGARRSGSGPTKDHGRRLAAATKAQRIRTGAGAWAWDSDALDWHGNEVTLVHQGQVLRIDRLVRHRESGAWWVFDYKSAARPERDADLIAQLNRYRDAVRDAYPGETVRAAFLTGQGELVTLE